MVELEQKIADLCRKRNRQSSEPSGRFGNTQLDSPSLRVQNCSQLYKRVYDAESRA